MLRNYIRVLYSLNGALTDVSDELQNGTGYVTPMTLNQDYIYIGQYMPFNNFFALMKVLNTTPANLTLQYFDGSTWVNVVDMIDSTKGFTKTGVIQFTPDKSNSWEVVEDTSEVSSTFELKTKKIYNLYWIRIKSSATMSLTTAIEKLTYCFCDTADLKKSFSEIDSYLPAIRPSASDWYPEIIDASEQVAIDLKGKGLISHPGQILLFDDVSYATRLKTLINICPELGEGFVERQKFFEKEYTYAMSIKRFTLDKNKSASIEQAELFNSVGVLER